MPKAKKSRVCEKLTPKPTPYVRTTRNSNKEWENIQCTVCLEPPHQAVLLICPSHDKGCRPYICNSHVQYDCLAQYRATSSSNREQFSCPLCRGLIREERVVERAIPYLDLKVRACKYENCEFKGTREELTNHWLELHSNGPPKEELRRREEWEVMEQEWELDDIWYSSWID